MAQEVKTLVRFSALKEKWQPGDGLRANLRRGVKSLTLPRKLPNSALGLHREEIPGVDNGYRMWLLASSVFEGSHDGWVSFYEGDTHPVLWLGECKIHNCVQPNFKFMQVRFGIRRDHVSQALRHSGTPDEQAWMLSRFTPRLYPASIRWSKDKVFQIWIPL
mgnify:FL=1